MKMNDMEREINRIRINLYEETKSLTIEQRVKRSNELAEKLAKQYGFIIKSSPHTNGHPQ